MTIAKGDKVPDVKLTKVGAEGNEPVQTGTYFAGRKVALFSVPGAFTPTCSAKHLPGYVDHAAQLKAKGIDEIACTAVNDAFVMGAWGKRDGGAAVTMLADGNGDFAKATRRCVGVGKCRSASGGGGEVMCPSYRVTRDEKDVPHHLAMGTYVVITSDSAYAQQKGAAMIAREYAPAFPLDGATKDAGLIADRRFDRSARV